MRKIYLLISVIILTIISLTWMFQNNLAKEGPLEQDIVDESVFLEFPPIITPPIEENFKIYTLEEWYGEQLEENVYLDPNVITYDELRYLRVLHIGFDGLTHEGEIIVNKVIAEEVLEIFQELYEIGFPIERMSVISEYNGCDNASMEANNTHGFNFRKIAGTQIWSEHAFGLAIDINPQINPYVRDDLVKPANGRDFVERNEETMGIIIHGDSVYEIFTSRGWIWGGDWAQYGFRDYHHFERPLN